MWPVLFEIGGVKIYAHGFFVLAGLLTALAVVGVESRRRRWELQYAAPIVLSAFVAGMIGARMSLLLFHGWAAAPAALDFFLLFDARIGPGSILGGVIGAYIGGFVASRMLGLKGCACDAFAPAMALGLAVGRLGDFLSGEDGLGKPTELPWGVPLPDVAGLVHPAPLYDGLFNLIWFGALLALRNHPKMQDGNLLKLGIAGYALFRFCVEFVRNNNVLAFGLTGQQYVCLALLAAIGGYYGWKWLEAREARLSAAPR